MFDRQSIDTYYAAVPRDVRERLMREDAAYLLGVNQSEYLQFLIDEYKWEPLIWDESAMTVEPFIAHASVLGSRGPITTERPRIRIRLPFTPHPQREEYLRYAPTTQRMTAEPVWRFEGDVLVVEIDQDEQEVKRAIEEVRFWIGGRNRDIERGNANLAALIGPVLETRVRELKEGQERTNALLASIKIQLHKNPDARAKPVEIKRREIKTAARRPDAVTSNPEQMVAREDVISVVTFIDQYTRQFEVSPNTYRKFDEEELRDLIVAMLNVNYVGTVTAETFIKRGKTDICLRVPGGELLVCECKFWNGPEGAALALQQLFRYVTWRQTYGVLIFFCTVKDMTRAIISAKDRARAETSYVSDSLQETSASRFVTRHLHPQDSEKSIEVHHLFIDMGV